MCNTAYCDAVLEQLGLHDSNHQSDTTGSPVGYVFLGIGLTILFLGVGYYVVKKSSLFPTQLNKYREYEQVTAL